MSKTRNTTRGRARERIQYAETESRSGTPAGCNVYSSRGSCSLAPQRGAMSERRLKQRLEMRYEILPTAHCTQLGCGSNHTQFYKHSTPLGWDCGAGFFPTHGSGWIVHAQPTGKDATPCSLVGRT
jgi:hypothetical protein